MVIKEKRFRLADVNSILPKLKPFFRPANSVNLNVDPSITDV